MTEADILATTYDDTCAIYRPQLATEGRRSVFSETKIADGVPCALTQGGGAPVTQTPSFAHALPAYSTVARTSYALHTRPEVNIRANDRVEVRHMGETFVLWAGRPAVYPSHKFVPLSMTRPEEIV